MRGCHWLSGCPDITVTAHSALLPGLMFVTQWSTEHCIWFQAEDAHGIKSWVSAGTCSFGFNSCWCVHRNRFDCMAFSFHEKCWEYWYLILVVKLLHTREKALYVFKEMCYSFEEENKIHFWEWKSVFLCVSVCLLCLHVSQTYGAPKLTKCY